MRGMFAPQRMNAGQIKPPDTNRQTVSRSYTCPIPECAEADAVTVELHWDPGVGELGMLAGWFATEIDVVAHCGCDLRERERHDLIRGAEGEANGHAD